MPDRKVRNCVACGNSFEPRRGNQRRCEDCIADRVRNDEDLTIKSAPTRASRLNPVKAMDIERRVRRYAEEAE